MKLLINLHRWSLGKVKKFHLSFYWACDYLSMLEFKLIHVSKRAPENIGEGLFNYVAVETSRLTCPPFSNSTNAVFYDMLCILIELSLVCVPKSQIGISLYFLGSGLTPNRFYDTRLYAYVWIFIPVISYRNNLVWYNVIIKTKWSPIFHKI